MANDQAKRSLLDQLTDSATQPPPALPDALAPAAAGDPGPFVPPSLASGSATLPGSTANLESLASSPETLASGIADKKQTAENNHPGFLKTLGRLAGGAVGFTDPDSSPQANLGARIGALAGRTGNALAEAAGTPEQKNLAEERTQMPLKMAQIQNEREYRQGILGNKATESGIHQQNADTKGQVADIAQQNADSNEGLRDAHTKQVLAQINGQVHVDPGIAKAAGRPELADTDMSAIAYQQQVGNVVKQKQFKTQDMGADGMWIVSPVTGERYRIGSSPSMSANERYMNRPVQALNPKTGQIEWMRGGDAVSQGAAPAGPAQQIMSKQAQFSDIYSGLGSMRAAINGISQEPLDAATIGKLTLASRETDPTVYHQAIDTILGSEQLTPAQQDFIVAQRQLQERVMSLRNLAGMGNASDSLRAAITATLPTAKSGNVQMMRKQLDAVTNLVDNLHTGVPNINAGAPKKTATASTPQDNVVEYIRGKDGKLHPKGK